MIDTFGQEPEETMDNRSAIRIGMAMASSKFEDYAVKKEFFWEILDRFDVEVDLDTFADVFNHQVDNFLTRYEDSLHCHWHGHQVWVNAPFSIMGDVVLKLIYEKVLAVVIVPVWVQHHWFKAIVQMACSQLDYPVGTEFFEIRTCRGNVQVGPLPWGVKAMLVDTRLKIGKVVSAPRPGHSAGTKAAKRRERKCRTLLALGSQLGKAEETQSPVLTIDGESVDRWQQHGVDHFGQSS